MLSDVDIKRALDEKLIEVSPLDEAYIQPSSIDLRVGSEFRVFENHKYSHIDPKADQDDLTTLVTATIEEPFVLHPGEFVLGTTFERVTLSNKVVARLEGKSSLGRIGLLIHSTALVANSTSIGIISAAGQLGDVNVIITLASYS